MPVLKDHTVKKILLALCYATYAMAGLILGMRTNIFLFVQRDYLDGYSHIATLVLVSGIFMQMSLYYAGHLIERFGYRRLLTAGIFISAVPLVLMYQVKSILLFDINYALFMTGYGVVVLTLNLFASSLMPERRGNTLLMLHLFFSLGALTGPKWISLLTDRGLPWQSVISFSTVPFFIIAFLLFRMGSHVSESEKDSSEEESTLRDGGPAAYLREPYVWLFIVIFLCSQIWEYGIGTWFVIFANKTRG
jgi:fucose permease